LLLLGANVYLQLTYLGQGSYLGLVTIQGIQAPGQGLAPTVPDPGALVLALVDALFAVSTGLVLGQDVGSYARLIGHWPAPRRRPTRSGAMR
jgi:hypothetical protein